jgi:hypothetical protein
MALRLRVRGVPRVLCPNPYAVGRNPPRFIGKRLVPGAPAEPFVDRFEDIDEDVGDHAHTREQVRCGHLTPLDAETAAICGVPFDDARTA